jgi:DNA-binding transcriptional LysR family regulator
MEMHQIRYFLAVSQLLNFTRAAEECNVAQPSLTRAIKLLEAELGGDLFRRERNHTHLTEFGRSMLPLLEQCYDSAISAKRLATSYKKGVAETLILALSHTVSMDLIAAPVAELAHIFPRLELTLIRGQAGEVLEYLKKGEATFAIAGPLEESWNRLDTWPLFSEAFCALLPPNHPLAQEPKIRLADLAETPLITRRYCEHTSEFDGLLRQLNRVQGSRHGAANDIDAVHMVEAELGAVVLPRSAVPSVGLPIATIDGLDLERRLMLYGVSGRERSPAAIAFMKLLRARDWAGGIH